MTTNYLGEQPLPGLSAKQIAAIEAACSNAPASSHDGLLRLIASNIGDVPTTDAVVQAAIASAMSDNNIPTSFLHPFTVAATAGLPAAFMLGANAAHRQFINKSFAANGNLGADITKA